MKGWEKMALRICPDCGQEIRESAKFCPRCGRNLGEPGEQSFDLPYGDYESTAYGDFGETVTEIVGQEGDETFIINRKTTGNQKEDETVVLGKYDYGKPAEQETEILRRKPDDHARRRRYAKDADYRERKSRSREEEWRDSGWVLEDDRDNRNSGNKVKLIGGIAAVVVLLVAIIVLGKSILGDKKDDTAKTGGKDVPEATTQDAATTQTSTTQAAATTQASVATAATPPVTTPVTGAQEISLDGVSYSNYPDYDAVANPSDYNIVEVNNEFSFGYPRDFFERVEQEGNNYTFYTSNNTATLMVREEAALYSDPIQNVRAYFNDMFGRVDSNSQVTGVHLVSEELKGGWAHALVGGDYNDSYDSVYYIVVSNGSSVYSVRFDYETFEPGVYYNPQNYMIDCIYRLCEHSGTSYLIRNYNQFLKDDMGTKR